MWVLRSDFRGWISVLILAVTREHDAKDMWTTLGQPEQSNAHDGPIGHSRPDTSSVAEELVGLLNLPWALSRSLLPYTETGTLESNRVRARCMGCECETIQYWL